MDSTLCSSSTLTPAWGGGDRCCPATLCASMFLRRLTFYLIILRSTETHAEKKNVQRQSFSSNGGNWKPLLTSLNWWKRLSEFGKSYTQVQSYMTIKEVKLLHCCHFQFWLVRQRCRWIIHYNAVFRSIWLTITFVWCPSNYLWLSNWSRYTV